jgi:DNA invertase Pin-like site-specific DNA recombinase
VKIFINEFLLNIFGSLTRLEKGGTLQRQREGIEIAKREGKLEVTRGGMKEEKAMQAIEGQQEDESV